MSVGKNAENFVSYKYNEVDLEAFRAPSLWTKVKYNIVWLMSFKMVYNLVADALVLVSVTATGEHDIHLTDLLGFYAGTMGFAMLFLLVDLWNLSKAIADEDIPLSYLHSVTIRYFSLKALKYYAFYCKVAEAYTFFDKAALWLHRCLYEWPRLLLVHIPQLVLTVVIYIIKQARCEKKVLETCGYACLAAGACTPDAVDVLSIVLKDILIGLSIYQTLASIVLYPCVRCYITSETGELTSLEKYVKYRINRRVHEVVKKHLKGDPAKVKAKIARIEAQLRKDAPAAIQARIKEVEAKMRELDQRIINSPVSHDKDDPEAIKARIAQVEATMRQLDQQIIDAPIDPRKGDPEAIKARIAQAEARMRELDRRLVASQARRESDGDEEEDDDDDNGENPEEGEQEEGRKSFRPRVSKGSDGEDDDDEPGAEEGEGTQVEDIEMGPIG